MALSYALGIDPGKYVFHATLIRMDGGTTVVAPRSFASDREGFDALLEVLRDSLASGDRVIAGIEASGCLDDNLMAWLAGLREPFSITVLRLDSAQVARFSGPRPIRGKTDRTDARRIAQFTRAYAEQLDAFLYDEQAQAMLRLVNERAHWVEERVAHKNMLHDRLVTAFPEFTRIVDDTVEPLALQVLLAAPTAREASGKRASTLARIRVGRRRFGQKRAQALIDAAKQSVASACAPTDADTVRCLAQLLLTLNDRIKAIESSLRDYAEEHILTCEPTPATAEVPSPGLREQIRLADSITGIDIVGASTLVLRCGGVLRFSSKRALAAQFGTCPEPRQTGVSETISHLTYRGDRYTRKTIYMLTLAATRWDPVMAFHKWRLLEKGLTRKQAIAACMNRLVHWVYAVITTRTPYDPKRALATVQKQHPTLWRQFLTVKPHFVPEPGENLGKFGERTLSTASCSQ
jgi:transposase